MTRLWVGYAPLSSSTFQLFISKHEIWGWTDIRPGPLFLNFKMGGAIYPIGEFNGYQVRIR